MVATEVADAVTVLLALGGTTVVVVTTVLVVVEVTVDGASVAVAVVLAVTTTMGVFRMMTVLTHTTLYGYVLAGTKSGEALDRLTARSTDRARRRLSSEPSPGSKVPPPPPEVGVAIVLEMGRKLDDVGTVYVDVVLAVTVWVSVSVTALHVREILLGWQKNVQMVVLTLVTVFSAVEVTVSTFVVATPVTVTVCVEKLCCNLC